MDIQGKLISLLPEVKGTSAKGEWKKQEVIIETVETYPKKVCISFWGDKVEEIKNQRIGSLIKIHLNLESREYNGRWYTEARAWKIEAGDSGGGGNQNTSNVNPPIDKEYSESADLSPSSDGVDDLPF